MNQTSLIIGDYSWKSQNIKTGVKMSDLNLEMCESWNHQNNYVTN